MSPLLQAVILFIAVIVVVELFARWHSARQERRKQELRESWALLRASRAIHDETTVALRKMLDEARRSRAEGGE